MKQTTHDKSHDRPKRSSEPSSKGGQGKSHGFTKRSSSEEVRGGGEMPQAPGRPQREDDDPSRPDRQRRQQQPIDPEQEPSASDTFDETE